jgi:hypothetical protein
MLVPISKISIFSKKSAGENRILQPEPSPSEPRYTVVDGVKMQVFDEPEIEVPDLF